jgi:general secretion pathway protein H
MTPTRHPESGLTLIEVLVVLVIIGIMAGVTVLGLGSLGRGDRAETEARRLADRLQLASDDVLTGGTPIALVWDAQGYRFLAWDASHATWKQSPDQQLGARHALIGAMRLERPGTEGTSPVVIAPDARGAAIDLRIAGTGPPWRVGFNGLSATATPIGP